MSALPVQTGESLGYTFAVPGKVMGKGRARFGNGRVFTPKATEIAENWVRMCWRDASADRIDDGPVVLKVTAVMERPQAHYRKSIGGLSAAGRRSPKPTRKPDIDNVWKLVADALNGHAFRDDSQITRAAVDKRWANPGETEHLTVSIREDSQ